MVIIIAPKYLVAAMITAIVDSSGMTQILHLRGCMYMHVKVACNPQTVYRSSNRGTKGSVKIVLLFLISI